MHIVGRLLALGRNIGAVAEVGGGDNIAGCCCYCWTSRLTPWVLSKLENWLSISLISECFLRLSTSSLMAFRSFSSWNISQSVHDKGVVQKETSVLWCWTYQSWFWFFVSEGDHCLQWNTNWEVYASSANDNYVQSCGYYGLWQIYCKVWLISACAYHSWW